MVDYSQGEGNKRLRKRNKKPTKAQLARISLGSEEQARHRGLPLDPPMPPNRFEGSQASVRGCGRRVCDQYALTANPYIASDPSAQSEALGLPAPQQSYLTGARGQSAASASPEPSSGSEATILDFLLMDPCTARIRSKLLHTTIFNRSLSFSPCYTFGQRQAFRLTPRHPAGTHAFRPPPASALAVSHSTNRRPNFLQPLHGSRRVPVGTAWVHTEGLKATAPLMETAREPEVFVGGSVDS